MPLSELKDHVTTCPEVVTPCAASVCGCLFKTRRAVIEAHETVCPLAKMVPFFEAQNNRISSLELNMRHLQERNEILQDGMSNVQSKLIESSRITSQHNGRSSTGESENNHNQQGAEYNAEEVSDPSSSSSLPPNPTTYLLSLHESLREDVNQIGHALKDLDTRASMSIMTECMRLHEDMAHTNAALNSVRMQVQWLMSPRIPQPINTASTQGIEGARSRFTSSTSGHNSAGPSQGSLRPRRPSDSGREGTKL
ncbi:hypothetical protein N7495_005426 [Penicillium taxi]|uniref:uncharacterized protein n=1 Tax=Penicillium taxi TaxID=168475 RepID=UPI002544EC75|nr:uncharacterized protein N7495_005426 [Penicillium taxi]KAJ5893735.1 hypothetical protein N7495_005426 [Penicillium taxi]